MIEYCVCGHLFKHHTFLACVGCHDEHLSDDNLGALEWYETREKAFHDFKLDNLKLIEDLAKERNLV
jgi:hypothetical protein